MNATAKCPHCGSTELTLAVKLSQPASAGYIGLQFRTALVLVGSETVYADLCQDCGTLARMYVKQTDRNWITG